MEQTQLALADRQRQRLGMVAALLAALATVFALAAGDAKAKTDAGSSRHLSGGYGNAETAAVPLPRT